MVTKVTKASVTKKLVTQKITISTITSSLLMLHEQNKLMQINDKIFPTFFTHYHHWIRSQMSVLPCKVHFHAKLRLNNESQ